MTSHAPNRRRSRQAAALAAALAFAVCLAAVSGLAQRMDVFVESRNHPAIAYDTAAVDDAVSRLNAALERGATHLAFDEGAGYLESTLDALHISVKSQALVFSETSAQATLISPRNPRAIYFNDSVYVGWVRGADALEFAVEDPRQGAIFYTLDQKAGSTPRFTRERRCLECHLTWDTLGVPGLTVLSTFQMSDDPTAYATGVTVDHRTPLGQRWGGWYVTGSTGIVRHHGNVPVIVPAAELAKPKEPSPQLASVASLFDTHGYPSQSSDVVALMVLEHQTRMANLLTRVAWEARVAQAAGDAKGAAGPDDDSAPARVREAARAAVDYMLFVDEAPLGGRVVGTSGFAEYFSSQGPRDKKGRSLRQLDLEKRLLRYPCSYMIYAPAFDALPPLAKRAVYDRMWRILSAEETGKKYARLSAADRQAIVEILRDTKRDLPPYFREVSR
jgi:hypothetical protein